MKCDCCQQKDASIRIADVEANAISRQFSICPDCMTLLKRLVFDPARALEPTADAIRQVQDMLSAKDKGLALPAAPGKLATTIDLSMPICPKCGMTLAEFKQRERLGCPHDYEAFAAYLDPLLEQTHDVSPARHKGRGPEAALDAGPTDRLRELSRLKQQLDHAVLAEDYEQAARLRDRITALSTEGAAEGKA